MFIKFFSCSSEPSRVDKDNYLVEVLSLEANLREESSITDMSLLLELLEYPEFNYAYIDELKRYYYITDIVLVTDRLYRVELSIDVLMTYRDAILELNAFIDRNELEINPSIIDRKRILEQGYNVEDIPLPNQLFINLRNTEPSLILTGYYIRRGDIL